MGNSPGQCCLCKSSFSDSLRKANCPNCISPFCEACWGNMLKCSVCRQQISYPVVGVSSHALDTLSKSLDLVNGSFSKVIFSCKRIAHACAVVCIANAFVPPVYRAMCGLGSELMTNSYPGLATPIGVLIFLRLIERFGNFDMP